MSNQVYSNNFNAYGINTSFIGAETIQAKYINGQTGIFNSMAINDLQQDNTLDKFVVWDFDTSELKYREGVTGPIGSQGPTGPTGPTGNANVSNGTINNLVRYSSSNGLSDSGLSVSNVVTLNAVQTMLNKTLEAGKVTALTNQTYSSGYLPIGAKFDTGDLAVVTDVTTNDQVQTLNNKTLNFPIISTILNTGQLSLPVNVDDWLVGRNTTDTLTNKTLTLPTMTSIRNANNSNRTLNLPNNGASGDVILSSLATQQVINKSFNAELSSFYSNTGTNRQVRLDLFNCVDNTNTILNFQQSANRNIFYPDSDGTIVLDSNTQTLSGKTISSLTATGTSQSLLSGKQITTYTTLTTTTNALTPILTLVMSPSQTLTLEVDFSCICTAGPDLDRARGFSAVYLIKRTSLGVMNQFTITSAIAGDGGFAPTLSISFAPASFSLNFTGITGDTINLGGNYCINYR